VKFYATMRYAVQACVIQCVSEKNQTAKSNDITSPIHNIYYL